MFKFFVNGEEVLKDVAFHSYNYTRILSTGNGITMDDFVLLAQDAAGREMISEETNGIVEIQYIEPVTPKYTYDNPNVVAIQTTAVEALAIMTTLCDLKIIPKCHHASIARCINKMVDAGAFSPELFKAELTNLTKA